MKFIQILTFTSILLYSCNQNPQAENETAVEPAPVFLNADSSVVNLKKSVITWIGSKPTGQHDGTIDLSDGVLLHRDNEIVGGSVTIDITSIEVMNLEDDQEAKTKLTSHLLSEDFFDSVSYKTGFFEITSITAFDSSTYKFERKVEFPSKHKPESAQSFAVKQPNALITGNLTLRGATHAITFPAKVNLLNGIWSVEAKFNLDRTKWGLSYDDEASLIDKAKDKFIYNTVNAGFYLETEPSAL